MSSYLYRNICYADPASVYAAMAAACPSSTSSGDGLYCTPTSNGYITNLVTASGTTSLTVVPTLVDCIPEYADTITAAGLITAALSAAWAIRILVRAL